eukprot:g11780.t1
MAKLYLFHPYHVKVLGRVLCSFEASQHTTSWARSPFLQQRSLPQGLPASEESTARKKRRASTKTGALPAPAATRTSLLLIGNYYGWNGREWISVVCSNSHGLHGNFHRSAMLHKKTCAKSYWGVGGASSGKCLLSRIGNFTQGNLCKIVSVWGASSGKCLLSRIGNFTQEKLCKIVSVGGSIERQMFTVTDEQFYTRKLMQNRIGWEHRAASIYGHKVVVFTRGNS